MHCSRTLIEAACLGRIVEQSWVTGSWCYLYETDHDSELWKPRLASTFKALFNWLYEDLNECISSNPWKVEAYKPYFVKGYHLISWILWTCSEFFKLYNKRVVSFPVTQNCCPFFECHHLLLTLLSCNFLFTCIYLPQDWISWRQKMSPVWYLVLSMAHTSRF